MKWVVEVKTRKCSKDTAIACLEVMEAALYDFFFFLSEQGSVTYLLLGMTSIEQEQARI